MRKLECGPFASHVFDGSGISGLAIGGDRSAVWEVGKLGRIAVNSWSGFLEVHRWRGHCV